MTKKNFSIIFIAILVGGLAFGFVLINRVHAASYIPKPSIPEFTVEYVDSSYYVAPVYGVDPYSGKTVQTGGDFYVQNKTIVITVKNQPFTPYKNEDGRVNELEYRVKHKGHFAEYWSYFPRDGDGGVNADLGSGYALIVFGLGIDGVNHHIDFQHADVAALSAGDQMDFQVQVTVGYYHSAVAYEPLVFFGESSDWSNTQTLTMGASTMHPDPFSPQTSPHLSNSTTTPETSPSTSDQTTEPALNETSQTLLLDIIIGTVLAIVL